jgi:hypothetical protein
VDLEVLLHHDHQVNHPDQEVHCYQIHPEDLWVLQDRGDPGCQLDQGGLGGLVDQLFHLLHLFRQYRPNQGDLEPLGILYHLGDPCPRGDLVCLWHLWDPKEKQTIA